MFEKIKYRFKILTQLYPFAKGVKAYFFLITLTSAGICILTFVNPLIYKMFIEKVLQQKQLNYMLSVATGYIAIFILSKIFGYIRLYSKNKVVNKTTYKVKAHIFQGYMISNYEDEKDKTIGDKKMSLEDDSSYIEKFSLVQTNDYLICAITSIVSFYFLIKISILLSCLAIAIIPVTFWLDHMISKEEAGINAKKRINDEKMSSWLHVSLQGWQEIKSLAIEEKHEKKFSKFLRKYGDYYQKWINFWVLRVLIVPKIKDEFFMKLLLYFFGGILIINGNLKIVNLLLFATYYQLFANSIKSLSLADAELQAAKPYTDRLLESLVNKELDEDADIKEIESINTIKFENIDFKYGDSSKYILKDLSFAINKGERIGIVGESGKGKSTILKLIAGFHYPTKGRVLLSGESVKNISSTSIYNKIGFIMQENMLFNTTIKENLQYGKNDASFEEMELACSKAGILETILAFPMGFDTIIGENGSMLSGGQRQRIILARLFLRDVDVYIFDEATSALDEHSESIVNDTIHAISSDKIVIIVAHRDSSIALCDRIIKL